MDIRNVVIIFEALRFTKDDIVKDIQEEGYKHNFFFANCDDVVKSKVALELADEVWIFGDCKDIVYFKQAKELGKDIWVMKR